MPRNTACTRPRPDEPSARLAALWRGQAATVCGSRAGEVWGYESGDVRPRFAVSGRAGAIFIVSARPSSHTSSSFFLPPSSVVKGTSAVFLLSNMTLSLLLRHCSFASCCSLLGSTVSVDWRQRGDCLVPTLVVSSPRLCALLSGPVR